MKENKAQTKIYVWKKTKPQIQNTSKWIKKKIGLKIYLNTLTSPMKSDFEKNLDTQVSWPLILGHCAWPKVYHNSQWSQVTHYNHSSLLPTSCGCGHGYNLTNHKMPKTHHWKMMNCHHCINNWAGPNRLLLQLPNHIWKHHIIVQIAQESQWFPTKVWCNTFPTCNKDQQVRSN